MFIFKVRLNFFLWYNNFAEINKILFYENKIQQVEVNVRINQWRYNIFKILFVISECNMKQAKFIELKYNIIKQWWYNPMIITK